MFEEKNYYKDLFDSDELDLNNQLEIIKEELPLIRIERLCNTIKELENLGVSCTSEIERLKDKKRSAENKIENIKKHIMFLIGDDKLNIGTYTLSTRNTQAVDIDEVIDIKRDDVKPFIKTTIKEEISKTLIKDYLTKDQINEITGEVERVSLDFARLKNNKSLQIK